jgi:4-hydroxymandelate oxidase
MGEYMTRQSIVNLQDFEQAAKATMSDAAWAYFSGGAANEITVCRNEKAWQSWGLAPRVLQNLRGGHTNVQLLGRTLPAPLLVAPMAYQRWAHPDGESGMVLPAAAQGCGFVLSHQTSTPLQKVAVLVVSDTDRGPLWFQLYWMDDRDAMCDLISQIEAAGFEALVVTVDAPVHGVRDRERRHGIVLPEGMRAAHWSPNVSQGHGLCAGLADSAPTWGDIEWLISQTRLPVLLKGITHPDDARLALDVGAAGVIVSNHGGRVLDTMPASAEVLPRIAEAIRSSHPSSVLLVDGGIRRGTDVLKALALGADAVLIGRPALYGLAESGAKGAAHVLRLLRDEFEMTMALCGCPAPSAITREHLQILSPL